MRFKKSGLLILFLLPAFSQAIHAHGSLTTGNGNQTADTVKFVSPFYEDNERCFKCHGQGRYEYTNENLGRQVKALMFPERIITRDDFYRSNHKSFSCTDCHSGEYVKFPHPGELRMEQMYNCMDCHGGDEKFSQFNFEEIDAQYRQSVHFKLEEEGFTCWKCHNPHTYRLNIRLSSDIKESILFDNNMCLNCHADYDKFHLLSDREEMSILEKHDWLPNQTTHFRNVRCIECHTQVDDSVLVSHQITPRESAVKKCNECHSQNSLLMASLYKFQAKEQRKSGFLNGVILNESYVIGANRNNYLNIFSIIIFGFTVMIVGVHIYFRISGKKSK